MTKSKDFFKHNKPEILAPAGGFSAVKAAINAGADAVYIGGTRFGARAYAENPEQEELLSAISFVHRNGKRLYLTVNTLVKEQEYSSLYEFLAPFYENGLDAAIVQDVGVLQFLSREFPELSLHASTQMTLTGADGVSLFDGLPVTRLVPARELSIPEIREITEKSGKEVEIFVHGALCYCYSGQCLMSSMIGGRSGNRGRCAQPCRMEYRSATAGAGYFLSPKDLCGLPLLPDLIDSGAASFKIEGRMKRPEYSALVTAAYRKFTDLYCSMTREAYEKKLKQEPELLSDTLQELSEAYNRGGFSTGCLKTHNGTELMSMERPNHYGILAGRAIREGKGEITFLAEEELHPQDVLEIRRPSASGKENKNTQTGAEAYYEYTVGAAVRKGQKVTARLLPKLSSKPGDLIYRMKNQMLLDRAARDFMENEAKGEVIGHFFAKSGEPMQLTVSIESITKLFPVPFQKKEKELLSVTVFGQVCEKAGKLPASKEQVLKQLNKTGNEDFFFREITVELSDDVFLPNGQLNELRREALLKLSEKQKEFFSRTKKGQEEEKKITGQAKEPVPKQEMTEPLTTCLVTTPEQAEAVGSVGKVFRVYLDSTFSEEERLKYAEYLKKNGKEVYLCLPRIYRKELSDPLSAMLSLYPETVDGFLVRNYEELAILKKRGTIPPKSCVLDFSIPVFSKEAKSFFLQLFGENGHLTASAELTAAELTLLSVNDMSLVVYGYLPVMLSTHCVCKNTIGCHPEKKEPERLKDRVNKELIAIKNCRECLNVIYNPDCLCLLTEQEQLSALSPYAYRYDFTVEQKAEVLQVLTAPESLMKIKNMNKKDQRSYTKGHFYRGVE